MLLVQTDLPTSAVNSLRTSYKHKTQSTMRQRPRVCPSGHKTMFGLFVGSRSFGGSSGKSINESTYVLVGLLVTLSISGLFSPTCNPAALVSRLLPRSIERTADNVLPAPLLCLYPTRTIAQRCDMCVCATAG